MLHKMKLWATPFELIKNGDKTIEMRLFDEKRKLLRIGDMIEFTCIDSGNTILCEVKNLFKYNNFTELYGNHHKKSIGYLDNEVPSPYDMLKYYSEENIKLYGVLAIELKLLKK